MGISCHGNKWCCSAATIIGGMVAFGILFAAYIRSPSYIQMPRKDRWLFDRPLLRRLLRFGLPTGIEMFLNVFAFNIFIQLMHSMGPNIAAVVTIVFNYDLLAFIPMTGLGFAVTALVGQQMGAGSIKGAQETAMLSLRVGWSYACIMMMLFIIGAEPLVSVFTRKFFKQRCVFYQACSHYAEIGISLYAGRYNTVGAWRCIAGCRRYAVGNDYFCRNTLAACGCCCDNDTSTAYAAFTNLDSICRFCTFAEWRYSCSILAGKMETYSSY